MIQKSPTRGYVFLNLEKTIHGYNNLKFYWGRNVKILLKYSTEENEHIFNKHKQGSKHQFKFNNCTLVKKKKKYCESKEITWDGQKVSGSAFLFSERGMRTTPPYELTLLHWYRQCHSPPRTAPELGRHAAPAARSAPAAPGKQIGGPNERCLRQSAGAVPGLLRRAF